MYRIGRETVVVCGLVLGAGICMVAGAQDMRPLTEPKIPPVCTKLEARLYAEPDTNGGRISEEDEQKLDTARIQKALNGCTSGQAVELASGLGSEAKGAPAAKPERYDAFLSGPLDMREGVTLLIDKGVTVYGSRDPRDYEIPNPDAKPGDLIAPIKCGTSTPRPTTFPTFSVNAGARPRGGCRPLIAINDVKNVGIMGEGTIDGRGYATLAGHNYSWWQMARKAQPNDDLYYSTRLISANHADGLVLYKITLHNSPNFHVGVNNTNGFMAWGVHLQTPVDKSLDARNTDGIDPGTSQNVTVAYSWIDNGDDNIAIKQGVSHMSVVHDHFYNGHGMSIGSETMLGQSDLVVHDLVEDHTSSGIRIKSNVKRGGPVHDLIYKGICMRDVPIPIAISPYYTNQTVEPFEDPKYTGDKIPDYKGILLQDIYSETPGDVLIAGLNDEHRTQVTLKNVIIKGIKPSQVHLFYDDLTVQAPGTNLPLREGANKTVKLTEDGAKDIESAGEQPDPCAGKFVPMQ